MLIALAKIFIFMHNLHFYLCILHVCLFNITHRLNRARMPPNCVSSAPFWLQDHKPFHFAAKLHIKEVCENFFFPGQ